MSGGANRKGKRKSVVFAPSAIPWVPRTTPKDGVPVGLEYLVAVDEVVMIPLEDKQGFEEIDRLSLKNTYEVRSRDGERMYLAVLCERPGLVFRRQWAFRLSFYDQEKRRISIFNRLPTLHCCSCIETCRTQAMHGKVGSPVGEVGSVVSKCHWLRNPCFEVTDATGKILYKLKLAKGAREKTRFNIVNANHQVAGFMGVLREAPAWTLEEHRFHVAFPSSSDCSIKMLLMAATILLNILFWDTDERGPPPENAPTPEEECLAELLEEEMANCPPVNVSPPVPAPQERRGSGYKVMERFISPQLMQMQYLSDTPGNFVLGASVFPVEPTVIFSTTVSSPDATHLPMEMNSNK